MTTPTVLTPTTAPAAGGPLPPDDEITLLRTAAHLITAADPRVARDLEHMADAAEPLQPGDEFPPGYVLAMLTAGHIASGTWPSTTDGAPGLDYNGWPKSLVLLAQAVLDEHDGTPVTSSRLAKLLRMRAEVADAAADEQPEHASRYHLHAAMLRARADRIADISDSPASAADTRRNP
ncbi:hypothetical protein [Saccharothrix sp. HUAS TT1]|uniref:hypothetical protein n=1 Tax=unclassified Saccharothrix TaxID=2593673 RepID=UPI00345B798E